jgi:hypothetical protein
MQMMQTRFDVETIKLLIKTLDVAPQTALTPHETIAAAELAARLRFRCVKLWGAGYDQADDDDNPDQLAMDFASVPPEDQECRQS